MLAWKKCHTKLKADEQVNIVDTVFDWEKKIRHYDANKFCSSVTQGSADILVNNTNTVAVEQKEGQLIKSI